MVNRVIEILQNREIDQDKLCSVLKTLTVREKKVIELRYGLSGNCIHSHAAIGQVFKITAIWVRQTQAQAVRKLSHPIRMERLEEIALDAYRVFPGWRL